jgi:hypothetical protein
MTLKNAAPLALIGTGLLTILLAVHFILDILNAARSLIPAMSVLPSFIHVLASLSLAVFLYVFHNGVGSMQARVAGATGTERRVVVLKGSSLCKNVLMGGDSQQVSLTHVYEGHTRDIISVLSFCPPAIY